VLESAFNYACKETNLTLKNLKRTNNYDNVLKEVKKFLKERKKALEMGAMP